MATGYGIDEVKAKGNAIRNAVEQVIASYAASETIVTHTLKMLCAMIINR